MKSKPESADQQPEDPRKGPLHPEAGDGVVVIQDPPNAPLHMTPDEADISGIRMLDAADQARRDPTKPVRKPDGQS